MLPEVSTWRLFEAMALLILLPSRTGMLRSKPSPLDTFYRMNGRLGFDLIPQLVLWSVLNEFGPS